MLAFQDVKADLVVLELIGSDDRIGDCLIPVFKEIKSGERKLSLVYLSTKVYWTEACGFILYITISADGRFAEVSGYTVAKTI
jgi:hypothetical protein